MYIFGVLQMKIIVLVHIKTKKVKINETINCTERNLLGKRGVIMTSKLRTVSKMD